MRKCPDCGNHFLLRNQPYCWYCSCDAQERVSRPGPEAAVFAYIVAHKRQHDGNSPTIREIMRACDVSSTSLVKFYLDRLERQKRISRDGAGAARSIQVIGGQWTYRGDGS